MDSGILRKIPEERIFKDEESLELGSDTSDDAEGIVKGPSDIVALAYAITTCNGRMR